MIAAWIATRGPDSDAEVHLRLRLERLRIGPDQPALLVRHGPLLLGLLGDPRAGSAGPFEPVMRVDESHQAYVSGTRNRSWLHQLPSPGAALDRFVAARSGPFLLLIVDHHGNLNLYRDPLGDRAAFSRQLGAQLWLASDETALLDPGHALRDAYVAAHFALRYPDPTHSPFAEIACLPAGHRQSLDAAGLSKPVPYWAFEPDPAVRRAARDEIDQQFRSLLDQAVAACAGPRPPAVAVSGGMDSTAVAASPALPAESALWSYRLSDWADCNEFPLARALADHLERPLQAVDVADCGPLAPAFHAVPSLALECIADAYRAMRYRLATGVAASGADSLLTGDFADQLYCGWFYALRDLVAAGQWRHAARGLQARLISHGPRAWRDPLIRRLLPFNGLTRGWRRHLPEWLTGHARQRLSDCDPLAALRQPDRVEACLNPLTARAAHVAWLQGLAWGVEMRFPFRHLPLVQFMLSLPAHHWYDPALDQTKVIARRALAARLPAAVVERRDKTSLEPLFRHQVMKAQRHQVTELLKENQAWRRYVDPQWLAGTLSAARPSSTGLYVLWSCLSLALWRGTGLKDATGRPIDSIRSTG